SVARNHESVSRDQRARHDGGRRDARSRAHPARRPQSGDARSRAHRRVGVMQALRYAFEEATRSLWRGRQSGVCSAATVALPLFVLGAFLLVTANLERLGSEWSSAAELSVYLKDDISTQDRAAVERLLAPGELIAGSEFVSKADALARFKSTFTDLAPAV